MIPIQLTIQGLYSYQEKQTIDFTKLTGASLFGIFGTVGSGKSSILEAIIYALYGRTSRLNLAGDNRYYNMMNLKSDQLLIDFTFIAGKEQTKYRSVVKGKRNSKNFDDVKTLDRTSYKNKNNEWIPIEATELEQAVGLSYDNFRRTIIIPQGQFQEFLQLGNKDRTQMMKELFDLGKYEFSGKVSALETKNNAQKQHIEGQLQQLGEINESQIDVQQQQLSLLQNELNQLDNNYKTCQQEAEELNNLQVLVQKKSNTEQDFKTLLNQEPEYRKLENLISEYELCLAHFKLILNNLDDCESRKKHKTKQIEQERHQLKVLEEVIQSTYQEINKIRPAYENRDSLRQQAQDLLYIIKVKNLEEVINKNHARLLKGASILESTKTIIADLSKNKAVLEILVRKLKLNLPDMTIMVSAMEWHSENSNLNKQKTDIEAQLNKYNEAAKDLDNLFIKYLENSVFQNLQTKEGINSALEILEIENKHLKQQEIILQQEGDDLRLKDQLHKFAVDLEEGKACPLCGSLTHPAVYTIADIHESHLRLKKSKSELANRQESIHNLQLQLNNLQSRTDTNELYQKEWKHKYDDKLEEIKAHANSFHWEKYRVKESLDADFKKANELQAEIKAHENSLEALTIKLNTEQEKKDKYQNELDKITHEITIAKTEAKTLQEQIVDLDIKEYKDIPALEIEKERNRLLEEHVRLEKSFEKLNKQVEEQRKAAQSHTGTLLSLEKDLSTEMEKLNYITKEIDDTLRKYNYPSVESVRIILNQPIQLEAEKKKLQTFNQQKSLLKERLNQLITDINNRIYDPEAHLKLLAEVEHIKKELAEKNREAGKISGWIKKLKEGLDQKNKLTADYEKLELRAENIKTLKQLFKASGFVNYVSSVYLQNLCNAANDRFFQLTRQKLSLEITSDNNFQVRDFMNGGKIRSVKTLSGGQTFQAALSLALALADNIQKITESDQNFFFLDEGFGSLDKDSLSVVFDTLKTLRKENRIVGVISHVEEMQQEIDVHLQINHHEDRGSLIIPSWEV